MEQVRIQDDLYTYVNQEKLEELVIPEDMPFAGGFAALMTDVEKLMMGEFNAMCKDDTYPNDYLARACKLYMLAKELCAAGKSVRVILGFNTASEVFYEEEFRALGATVTVTTVDGSHGTKGFVTAALDEAPYTYFYTCGPEPMLRAVHGASATSGQFSFEERMGCGFGACMGCSCKTVTGNKRICKEGPVLTKEDIIWET